MCILHASPCQPARATAVVRAACCHRRHLRELMADEKRCMTLIKESEGIYFDFSRQRVNPKTIEVRACRLCCVCTHALLQAIGSCWFSQWRL